MSFSTWVGNVYQKFGAKCLGIEDAMYKDSISYVENQVQTVGESVKRFYSEMMQDLHPVSLLDPVGVVFADMSVNPYAYLEIEKMKKKENMKEHHAKSTDDTQVIKGRSTLGGIHRRRNVGTIKRTKGCDDLPLMASLPVTSKPWERKDMKSPVGETSEEIYDHKVGSPVISNSWERNKMKSSVFEIGETLEETCDHHKVDLPVTSKPQESNYMKSQVCEKGESLEEFFVHKEDNKMQTTGSSVDNVTSEVTLLVGSPIFEGAEKEIFDHKVDNNMQKTGSSIDNVASEVTLLIGSPVREMREKEIFDHKGDNNMQKTGSSIDNAASEVTFLVGSPGCEMGEKEIFDDEMDADMQTNGSSIDNGAYEVTLLAGSAQPKQEYFRCTSAFDGSSSTSNGKQEAYMPNPTIWASPMSDSETSEKHYFKVFDEGDDVEETCVLVEGDDYELLLPHDLVKHKSYKTIIREAFSSKKRLTKKKYQRLAKQHGEKQGLDKDSEGRDAPPDVMRRLKNDKISSAWDFPDSEWELL